MVVASGTPSVRVHAEGCVVRVGVCVCVCVRACVRVCVCTIHKNVKLASETI
jgi:hypothetical protein